MRLYVFSYKEDKFFLPLSGKIIIPSLSFDAAIQQAISQLAELSDQKTSIKLLRVIVLI